MKQALLILVIAGRGRAMGEGKTLSGGGGTIFLRVGEQATPKNLEQDWVLTHEMTHLTFPTQESPAPLGGRGRRHVCRAFCAREDRLADARRGVERRRRRRAARPCPRRATRASIARTRGGSTYWGGALFYLLADVGIRQRTQNKFGLEHALRGINAAGGNNAVRWSIEETFAAGDKAVGVPGDDRALQAK